MEFLNGRSVHGTYGGQTVVTYWYISSHLELERINHMLEKLFAAYQAIMEKEVRKKVRRLLLFGTFRPT